MSDGLSPDPLAHWPDRTPIYDESGGLLLVVSPAEDTYSGLPWIDGVWRPDDVPVAAAVETITSAFPGSAVSTSDGELASALLAAGAEETRHAHSLSHDLSRLPAATAPPRGLRVETVDGGTLHKLADPLGPVFFAAYPASHPDHSHDTVQQSVAALHRVADGEVLGPMLDASTVAWSQRPARLRQPSSAPAWSSIAPVGRPTAARGCSTSSATRSRRCAVSGRRCWSRSLEALRDAGLPGLSLVVSHDNRPAHRLYRAIGFLDISESWTLRCSAIHDGSGVPDRAC